MKPHHLLRGLLVAASAMAPVLAANWVVCESAGAGCDFTSIGAAVTAAAANDVIDVRAGKVGTGLL